MQSSDAAAVEGGRTPPERMPVASRAVSSHLPVVFGKGDFGNQGEERLWAKDDGQPASHVFLFRV